MSPYDREEEAIQARYANGEIDLAQYNREMKVLQCDYQADAQESAERAYRDEMERW